MTETTGNGKYDHPKLAASPFGVEMIGIGACVPDSVITNDDIATLVETSHDWIVTRTGIEERRVVSGDMGVADLAIGAAKQALESAGIDGSEIDFIICATSTPDTIYPATSCQVQNAIGAKNAAGFDMALACTGFAMGLVIAQQFIRTGMRKKVMVIGADIHSHYTDWSDRNTCILFGDGAGAAILSATENGDYFHANDLHLDGSKGMELTLYTNTENCPLVDPKTPVNTYVYMNGREVFKFAVGVVPESIRLVLDQAGMTMDDIDHVILHQANIRIMQAMSEKLGIPEEKLVINLQRFGNTSAATIPIALNEAVLSGRIKPGDKLVTCGFGAGLAWVSNVFTWTRVDNRLPQELKNKLEKELQKVN